MLFLSTCSQSLFTCSLGSWALCCVPMVSWTFMMPSCVPMVSQAFPIFNFISWSHGHSRGQLHSHGLLESNDWGEPAVNYKWTGWVLRNNRLKFMTAGELPIIFREIYRIYSNLIKENRRMSTYNWLDLQTLGSQPIMPKNLPDHCLRGRILSLSSFGKLIAPLACSCSSLHMLDVSI